jgi:lysine 2,3-aminomutase
MLDIAPHLREQAVSFAVAITPHLAELIDVDPTGAIARQFVPSVAETRILPNELYDPIGDDPHTPVKGIVHREPDRVLLKPVTICAAYCRFCFRRDQLGDVGGVLTDAELDAALDYIRATPAIWEVILSGGDPLVLSPRRLRYIMDALAAIPHVGTIRIHTRQPVADPDTITAELIDSLKCGKTVWVALHCNHSDELTPKTRAAITAIADVGIPLVSQTVLLKGINDDVATLDALFRRFIELRIKPYYLHHGDLARGTSHFRTSIVDGQSLMRDLRKQLSGLAIPGYMLDIPGGHGKVPVDPVYLHGDMVEDPRGGKHIYGE